MCIYIYMYIYTHVYIHTQNIYNTNNKHINIYIFYNGIEGEVCITEPKVSRRFVLVF